MVGQLSNFIKNFGKYIYPELINVGKVFKDGVGVAANIIWNLNKLDDPHINDKDKASAIFNAVTAPLSVVPIVGPMIDIATAAAPYIADVIEGMKDPPPVGSDINTKINPIGNVANKVINSNIFRNFFSKW
jgi:hypothetical protein